MKTIEIGKIVSTVSAPSFRRVAFILNPGVEVRFSDLVYIERLNGTGFTARVVGGMEDNPDASPGRLQRIRAFGIEVPTRRAEEMPGLVRVVQAELLEEIVVENGQVRLLPPRSLPITGASVYQAGADLIGKTFGFDPNAPIEIGKEERSGHPVQLPVEILIRHMAILGRPGTGKSYTTGVVLEECVNRKVPIVIVDITGEAVQATNELSGVVLTPGAGGFTVRLAHLSSTEIPDLAPNLSPDQKDLVIDAFENLQQQRGAGWDLPDLLAEIDRAGKAMGVEQVAKRAQRRLDYAIRTRRFIGQGVSWKNLFVKYSVVNIFAGPLPKRHAALAVAAVCRELQHLRDQETIPPFVFILDEAHRFVPSGGEAASSEVIANFLRIGRHLKIGTMIVSQSPSGISREILILTNTRMIHALDGTDMHAVSGLLGDAPEELVNIIPTLPAGTAVLCGSQELVRHTCTVAVRKRRTTHGAPTPDLAREAQLWREKNLTDLPNK